MDELKPNVARIYDYMLGGTHNFRADREAADEVVRIQPLAAQSVRENRGFLIRAARYLAAEAGIRQFLDIGAGLPTMQNVHQVVQETVPGARVVYADHDPDVVGYATDLLANANGVAIIQKDIREPEGILSDPVTRSLIDFSDPIGLFLVSILHFLPDGDDPHQLVRHYLSAVAPGSYLVMTHASVPAAAAETTEGMRQYNARTNGALTLRSPEEIARFFGGLELLAPGLVNVARWRPVSADSSYDDTQGGYLGGVARIPGGAERTAACLAQ